VPTHNKNEVRKHALRDISVKHSTQKYGPNCNSDMCDVLAILMIVFLPAQEPATFI